MARRKSAEEVGPLGVWAYDTRDALDLSVEAAVALLPTTYHPATLRKVEGGSARPGTRMWRELGALYLRLANERGVQIGQQPRLRPEPAGATETPDSLVAALTAQTAALSALVDELQAKAREDAVARQELMKALGAALDQRETRRGDGRGTPAGAAQ